MARAIDSKRRRLVAVCAAIALAAALGAGGALAEPDPLTGDPAAIDGSELRLDLATDSGADRFPVPEVAPPPVSGALYATNSEALYRIDKSTGEATQVGFHGGVDIDVVGIAFGKRLRMYAIDNTASASLFTMDPSTGVKTAIGALAAGFIFEGALAIDGAGRILAANGGNATAAKLVEINETTGKGTLVGPPLGEIRDLNGFCYDGSHLLAIDRETDSLGEVNPATGTFQVIGAVGATIGAFGGLARDPVDGRLYAAIGSGDATDPSDLYTIDRVTGTGTFVAHLSIPVYDLTFAPSWIFLDGFESGDPSAWDDVEP